MIMKYKNYLLKFLFVVSETHLEFVFTYLIAVHVTLNLIQI